MSIDSAVYPSALGGFLNADIDMIAGTIQIIAVTSGYVYDSTDDFLDDIAGGVRLGTAMTLTGKTSTGGVFNAAPGTYTGVAAAAVVDGFIGYMTTGVEATSPVIWYCNARSDMVELTYTGDGTGISISWPLGFIFSI